MPTSESVATAVAVARRGGVRLVSPLRWAFFRLPMSAQLTIVQIRQAFSWTGIQIWEPDRMIAPVIAIFARDPIRWGLRIMSVSIFGGGAVFSMFEKDASWFDGMWWAFISAMTVGYGDFSPKTPFDRVVAVVIVFGGALFIIGLASAVTSRQSVYRMEELLKADTTDVLNDDVRAIALDLRQRADELEAIGDTLAEREADGTLRPD